MVVHDWTLVEAGIFHAFHVAWIGHLQTAMNEGLLPPDYYALAEQHATPSAKQAARVVADMLTLHGPGADDLPPLPPVSGGLAVAEAPPKVRHHATLNPSPRTMRRTLALRHVSGHRLVAVIEIVSPSNKDRPEHVEELASKIAALLEAGIHVLLVDLFPPGLHDPQRMHGAIGTWTADHGLQDELPSDAPLTLASYRANGFIDAYVETLAVGQGLPDMPLFFHPERYVNVPLAPTYDTAFRGMPAFWRRVLEGGARQS